MENQLPIAKKQNLVIREVADEVLIYDLPRDKAFCLNRTAAAVWRHSDGAATPAQISASISRDLGVPVPEKLVWVALDQLGRDGLLEARVAAPASVAGLTRREQLRSLGKVAAIALPLITALAIPKNAAAAASCAPSGAPCSQNKDCCSRHCGSPGNAPAPKRCA